MITVLDGDIVVGSTASLFPAPAEFGALHTSKKFLYVT